MGIFGKKKEPEIKAGIIRAGDLKQDLAPPVATMVQQPQLTPEQQIAMQRLQTLVIYYGNNYKGLYNSENIHTTETELCNLLFGILAELKEMKDIISAK